MTRLSPAQRDLHNTLVTQERQLDAIFARLAKVTSDAIERHSQDGQLSFAARQRVMAEIDAELARLFGAKRGERGAVQAAIERGVSDAAGTVAHRQAVQIATALQDAPRLAIWVLER